MLYYSDLNIDIVNPYTIQYNIWLIWIEEIIECWFCSGLITHPPYIYPNTWLTINLYWFGYFIGYYFVMHDFYVLFTFYYQTSFMGFCWFSFYKLISFGNTRHKCDSSYMWHDQWKWVTCRKCQFLFSYTTFLQLQNASFWCKPHYNWIWSYEEFNNAKNNIKQRNLNTVFAIISK